MHAIRLVCTATCMMPGILILEKFKFLVYFCDGIRLFAPVGCYIGTEPTC